MADILHTAQCSTFREAYCRGRAQVLGPRCLRSFSWPVLAGRRAWWSGSGCTARRSSRHCTLVPAGSLRVGVHRLGRRTTSRCTRVWATTPSSSRIEPSWRRRYDADFTAASSIDERRSAMHENFGFGPGQRPVGGLRPGSQGRDDGAEGAPTVPTSTCWPTTCAPTATPSPRTDDGVWKGGVDLVAQLDPTLTPELQYVALLEDEGLVVTSDTPAYAATLPKVASGDGDSVASRDGVADMARQARRPGQRDGVDRRLRLRRPRDVEADRTSRTQASPTGPRRGRRHAAERAGDGDVPDRTLRVVEHFEDSTAGRGEPAARAKLAVGEAPGRGGSFSDDFKLTSSRSTGSQVVLDLTSTRDDGLRPLCAVRRTGAVRDLLSRTPARVRRGRGKLRHANVAGVAGGADFRHLRHIRMFGGR